MSITLFVTSFKALPFVLVDESVLGGLIKPIKFNFEAIPTAIDDKPIFPKRVNVPDIPHEVNVEKMLPAATLPIVDCIPAAIEPANSGTSETYKCWYSI
jgi:hypothetical protein